MVVEDIESMMKDLIRLAYSINENEDEPERLREAIAKYTRYKKGKPFDKLSFGDYMQVLLAEENWPKMQPSL